MSTFTPVVPTSPPQSNSAQTPAALSLEARFRASQYNRADAIYDLASRLNVSDTSKLNVDAIPERYAGTSGPARSFARANDPAISKLDIDSIPAQFNVNSRLSGLPSQASKLNIDSIPARFNVSSRLSGLPSQASKLDRDGIPSRYAP